MDELTNGANNHDWLRATQDITIMVYSPPMSSPESMKLPSRRSAKEDEPSANERGESGPKDSN